MIEEHKEQFDNKKDVKKDMESLYKLISLIDPNNEHFKSTLKAIHDVSTHKDDETEKPQIKRLK